MSACNVVGALLEWVEGKRRETAGGMHAEDRRGVSSLEEIFSFCVDFDGS